MPVLALRQIAMRGPRITSWMTEGDVLQIEEYHPRIICPSPRFFVIDGQIIDVFDPLATAVAGILVGFLDEAEQEHPV